MLEIIHWLLKRKKINVPDILYHVRVQRKSFLQLAIRAS